MTNGGYYVYDRSFLGVMSWGVFVQKARVYSSVASSGISLLHV